MHSLMDLRVPVVSRNRIAKTLACYTPLESGDKLKWKKKERKEERKKREK